MALAYKDYSVYPKFRHNLWTNYKDDPSITFLTVSHGAYEVSTEDANKFIKIRTFCTGHNSYSEIASKSQTDENEVRSIIGSLAEIDVLHLPIKPLETLSREEITNTLQEAAGLWGEQLADTHISREIFMGNTSKNVVIGWLLESYHYVRLFPNALAAAAANAEGELKNLLTEYQKQEQGHEYFILQTLLRAGLSKEEIETSIPLISTRTIDLLFTELFSSYPAATLLVASIIEADDMDEDGAKETMKTLHEVHGFPLNMLEPFFEHVRIDGNLGHQTLLTRHLHFLDTIQANDLHDIVNKIHDIKHAFDLQKLEILDYYSKQGNYIPRQFVDYFAI